MQLSIIFIIKLLFLIIYSFIRQALGCILCEQKYLKCQRYSGNQDRQNPFPLGGYILTGRGRPHNNRNMQDIIRQNVLRLKNRTR